MWVAFAITCFQQKISAYLRITHVNFNESLTNDIGSFEQLGPVLSKLQEAQEFEIQFLCINLYHSLG